ncbi:hypothetical protein Bbelb_210880 [Branchiostoma belcheri]|nr:hypothetical protein Bbelb_210880 [Branchiostoma belcheri]
MASSTPVSSDMKTRILKRLSLFEPHQNNPPWQADRIGEVASNNSPPILEALKDVRHELFAQFESLPNKPDSFADGRLVRRNKNTTQRFTLIKDIIALFNFIKHGDLSKELRDCVRSSLDPGMSSQVCENNDLGTYAATADRDEVTYGICESCKLIPESVKSLATTVQQMQAEIKTMKKDRNCNSDVRSENEDLVVEVQRLRDENASLLRIIEELSQQQKPDDWRTAEKRCTRVNKPSQEVIRTSNRFSPLSTPVSVDIDVDFDSPNEREMSRQETQECPISQQIGMYRKHQRTKFYNTTTQDKTAIIGDSMIKHLKSKKMSRRGNVKCYTHRGARLEQLTAPAQRIVRNETPSRVIVHAGTNNNNEPAHVVTRRAFHLASTLQRSGAKNVAVSGVIMRANGGLEWTRQVNLGMQQMCDKNGWHFIDNNNIGLHHICPDGVHLNRQGTIQLAKNFIGFLNGERQARVRNGTSFADALRAPPPLMPRGFRGRHPDWNMW